MRVARLGDITVPEDRQRKHFDLAATQRLATSIADKGLLHPIVCSRTPTGLCLVAGNRRLKAVSILARGNKLFDCDGTTIEPGKIPYILITDRTDLQLREAELEENVIREDLSWQERTRAIDELHSLRLAQDPKQTLLDTGIELAGSTGSPGTHGHVVSRAKVVAQHLDDPEIAAARNEREAFAIASRKIEGEFQAELKKRGKLRPKSPHTLIHGSMLDELATMKPEQFDCVIADPPYGMGADEFGDAAKLEHRYKDDPAGALQLATCILEEGNRITKKRAHLYLFCDIGFFGNLKACAKLHGWEPFRTPLVWSKGSSGHAPIGTRGFRRSYELILFASKGGRPLSGLHSDVIEVPNLKDRVVAAQKPTGLYEKLLRYSCVPGDRVLDPCCGSGTVFPAATATSTVATGIELDEGAYRHALITLEGES
ncbi:MAG: DNA methyltransferase [Acidobacteriota bacterium]